MSRLELERHRVMSRRKRSALLVPVVGLTVFLGGACGSGETAGGAASASETAIDPSAAALSVADLSDAVFDVRRDPG